MTCHNKPFFQVLSIKIFLDKSVALRKQLLDELITSVADPQIRMRRLRMLQQLSLYEHQIIKKIEQLDTDDNLDYLDTALVNELFSVVNRNA